MTSPFPSVPPPPTISLPLLDGGIGEIWASLIPYLDLQAKGIPERHLRLGQEVLPVLAIMSTAKGPGGPRLLTADAAGHLVASADPSVHDVLTAPIVAGQNVFTPATPSLYFVGQHLYFPGPTVAGTTHNEGNDVVSISQDGIVTTQFNFLYAHDTGSQVILVAVTHLIENQHPKAPYDSQLVSIPVLGQRATVVVAPPAGQIALVDSIDASMFNNGAVTVNAKLRVIDVTAANVILWAVDAGAGPIGAGATWNFQREHVNVVGPVDHQLNVEFDAGFANVLQSVNTGVYFMNAAQFRF